MQKKRNISVEQVFLRRLAPLRNEVRLLLLKEWWYVTLSSQVSLEHRFLVVFCMLLSWTSKGYVLIIWERRRDCHSVVSPARQTSTFSNWIS